MISLNGKADLHCHTTFSDSSATVCEVIDMAKARSLSAIAITDHDTLLGIPKALRYGKKAGVKVIPGIELSAFDFERNRKAHILAYNIKRPEILRPVFEYTSRKRREAGLIMVKKLCEIFPVTPEMLLKYSSGNIYKQHLMHALMDAGYEDKIFGEDFSKFFSSHGGIAFAPIEYQSVFDVVQKARESGAIVALAHPANYHSEDLLLELCEKRMIDAVEVWHETANQNAVRNFSKIAEKYGLIKTGGTDFHGMYHKYPTPIGSYTAPLNEINKLI